MALESNKESGRLIMIRCKNYRKSGSMSRAGSVPMFAKLKGVL
jgi:hypothetical protein